MPERYSDDFDLPVLAASASPLHGYRGDDEDGAGALDAVGLTIA